MKREEAATSRSGRYDFSPCPGWRVIVLDSYAHSVYTHGRSMGPGHSSRLSAEMEQTGNVGTPVFMAP